MNEKPTYEELEQRVGEFEQVESDRQKAVKEMESAKAFMDTVVDRSPFAMWIADQEGTVIRTNHSLRRILNLADDQIIGKYNVLEDANLEKQGVMPLVRSVFDGHQAVRFSIPWKANKAGEVDFQGGKDVHIDVSIFPILDGEGQLTHVVCQWVDVTERKQAEEALRRSEEFNRSIIENSGDCIKILDLHGNLEFMSKGGQALLEIDDIEPFLNNSWIDFWEGDDNQNAREAVDRAKAGKVGDFQGYCPTNKGTPKWWDVKVTPIYDSEGNVEKVLSVSRDITVQKRAEEALRKERNLSNRIITDSPLGIAILDTEGAIVFANHQAEIALGLSKSEMVGRKYNEPEWHISAVDGKPFPIEQLPFRRVMGSGKAVHDVQHAIEWPNGDRRVISVNAAPLMDQHGHIERVVCVVEDITERLSVASQLNQAQKLESVGRLAGGVAHDFNNIIGVILGKAEMALMDLNPDDTHYKDFQEIHESAKRASDVTRQLLAFARKQPAAPKVLDINATIEGMLKMLRRLIGEHIHLAWLPRAGLWPVKMDPSQIDQILANLSVNARDAIEDTGKITIETGNVVIDESYCHQHPEVVPGEYVMLAFSDDGKGMDKQTLGNIFEPFFTTKGVGEGTGLGLATIHGIVKQNKGSINVYSEPGEGTTFKIYLPRHAAEDEKMAPDSPHASVKRGQETVIVVEDDNEMLALTKQMLEGLGYQVLAVSQPADTVSTAQAHGGPIHLLLTDVIMPDISGRDLSEKLTAICPELKCLFMSGYTANVIAHHGVLDEGVHFIQKPFSIRDLSHKVREAIESEK